jgi:hypothetical protein
MQNCNHEEADTRIAVHLLHAARDNINKNILVKTVDTDVVVILVAAFRKVLFINNKVSIWVEFGMGKTVRHLHIKSIYHKLGENKSRSLPTFHALTGCDSTSNFLVRGKNPAWNAWSAYPEVTDAHTTYGVFSQEIIVASESFRRVERFVVVLYERDSYDMCVNNARLNLFTKSGRQMEKLPPTQVNMI